MRPYRACWPHLSIPQTKTSKMHGGWPAPVEVMVSAGIFSETTLPETYFRSRVRLLGKQLDATVCVHSAGEELLPGFD